MNENSALIKGTPDCSHTLSLPCEDNKKSVVCNLEEDPHQNPTMLGTLISDF